MGIPYSNSRPLWHIAVRDNNRSVSERRRAVIVHRQSALALARLVQALAPTLHGSPENLGIGTRSMRISLYPGLLGLLCCTAFGQVSATLPGFEITDVHSSVHVWNPTLQGGALRASRYEIRHATLLDLIQTAYSVDAFLRTVRFPNNTVQ